MVFDILKGWLLVIFTILLFIVGWTAEALCVPLSRCLERPLINDFIRDLWKNSFKH